MNEIINNYPIPRTIEDTLFTPQPIRIPITKTFLSVDNWRDATGDNWDAASNWDEWELTNIVAVPRLRMRTAHKKYNKKTRIESDYFIGGIALIIIASILSMIKFIFIQNP